MFPRLAALLWNGRTRRPRLPWRFVLALVVLAVVTVSVETLTRALLPVPIESVLALVTPGFPRERVVSALRATVLVVGSAGVTVASTYLAGRFVDRRWFRDFGFDVDRSWWADLGAGLALGALLMTGVFLLELAAGWVVVTDTLRIDQPGFTFWPWFGWSLVIYVAVGVSEELLFRGYLLTNLAEGLTWFDRVGPTAAVGLSTLASSLLFGWAHAGNPSASAASTAGVMLGAVMLAAGYVLTGRLALPIGLHVTWNFVQGTVYGFPVSGTTHGLSVLATDQSGPRLLTGGAFGPEAGVIGAIAALVGTGLIVVWVRWREGRARIDPSVAVPALRPADADAE
ncbi:CPBP family intramembrane glutamic endopeptidase [Salinirubellus sp. GCM10025818]|uniref:CPBP family intramembrane glutamic endopeptidase n=1 Tax=Salinirubellus TaxID=2162630 RepID=UPI0030D30DED